jgi:hypothetical protein
MEAPPNVVFQEFSNEERCKAPKLSLESLKEAGAKLKSGLEDLKSIGKDGVIGRPSLWIAEDFGCCASG